jgi:hypothetical protein
LRGLREAAGRGDVGWLDVDPEIAVQARAPGVNLIFYHVGGNCGPAFRPRIPADGVAGEEPNCRHRPVCVVDVERVLENTGSP